MILLFFIQGIIPLHIIYLLIQSLIKNSVNFCGRNSSQECEKTFILRKEINVSLWITVYIVLKYLARYVTNFKIQGNFK